LATGDLSDPDTAAAAHSRPSARPPQTLFELTRSVDRRAQLSRTPRLVAEALQIVWGGSRLHLLALTALQLIVGVGVAVQLLIARRIMEELLDVSSGGPVSSLYGPFGLLVVVTATLGLVGALAVHEQHLLVELVGRYALDRIVAVASAVDFRLFETSEFYDQLQRARNSGMFRSIEMVNSVNSLIAALLTTVGIGTVLFILDPLLLFFVLLAAVPGLIAAIHNSRETYSFEYAMTPEGRERAYLLDLLTERDAAKEVRLFGLGPYLRGRYKALTDERLRRLRTFLRARLKVTLLATLAGAAGTAIALGALVLLLARDRIDVATALTAGLAMQQLGARLPTLTGSVGKLIESGMFIDDYQAFLELAPAAGDDQPNRTSTITPIAEPSNSAHVVVDSVSFSYPDARAPAVQEVSLEVGRGEIVALVGENGSGKTTLAKLICQLYRPQAGRILWNGVDTATLSPDVVRSEITVLFQDFIRYHLAALDNIVFGRVERSADVEAALAAARVAGADEFLSRLPDGYWTRLGLEFHGGRELSIGQWQRLALARAFFRGGSLLVLDEPTASLDARAERDLFTQMRELSEGRSVLFISHRFSSVRSADRIYVLERGRITEAGAHEELLALNGHYAELFNLQAAAYLDERSESRGRSDERGPASMR
jgi:ATP-binding cassette subfamily B protein